MQIYKTSKNCASKILAQACNKVDLNTMYKLKGKEKSLTYSNNIFLSVAMIKLTS